MSKKKLPTTQIDLLNLGEHDKGDYYERTEWNSLEKAFSEQWQYENQKRGCVNGGVGLLQYLLHPHKVSASERFVVATIIQWLGSNCGFAFLREVLRKEGMYIMDSDTKIERHGPVKSTTPVMVKRKLS